uniref:beta-arrestin-1-like n=1 Tax=Myxine glutinosa TaxID=7769 RepID=UPI00358F9F34
MMCGASAFTSAPKPELHPSMAKAPPEQTADTMFHERLLLLKKSSTSFFIFSQHDVGYLQRGGFDECLANGVRFALLCDQVIVHLGKRDFVDSVDSVEPVDGVVLVDPDSVKDQRVYVSITGVFRYGRQDMDVIGMPFRRDIYIAHVQLYPQMSDHPLQLTNLQQLLLNKLGPNAFPFTFTMPPNLTCSVMLQPGPNDKDKMCCVDFEVTAFCAKSLQDEMRKKSSVCLLVRKVQFAPISPGPPPAANFAMADKSLLMNVTLPSQTFYHGEYIPVNVHIDNHSNKIVKNITITVEQIANVVLYSQDKYVKIVLTETFPDTVEPNSKLSRTFNITPLLANNRSHCGIVLDGRIKHEDTNLASSTIIKDPGKKETLGILVSYQLKVKASAARSGDLAVTLPFLLMHPAPKEQEGSPKTSCWRNLDGRRFRGLN